MAMTKDIVPEIIQLDSTQKGYATCTHKGIRFSGHFAHLMQQFYRCWSFYQLHSDKIPVWYTEPFDRKFWKKALGPVFNRQLMDLLPKMGIQHITKGDQINLLHHNLTSQQLIQQDPTHETNSISVSSHPGYKHTDPCYQTLSVQHMRSFRSTILKALDIVDYDDQENITNKGIASGTKDTPKYGCHRYHDNDKQRRRIPRIALLNRKGNRQILNSEEIVQELTSHLQLPYDIPEISFDSQSLYNQVDKLANIDILITPHGAQETNLIFMPSCGAVLEVLPENYYYANFFGSLAASCGIDHLILYLAQNTSSREWSLKWRNPQFCIPLQSVREGIDQLIRRWETCCSK
jgi:hypothetical protein